MNVLILGGGLQGLSVAFSLYKIGYYIISIANDSMMLNSRFVNKKYKGNCCDLGFLEDVIKKETPNVIIPMGDKAAIFLSKNKELLESINNIKCAVYDYQTVELVHNKTSFMKFCEDNKIPHPITKQLTNENIEECVKNIGFPALIKPAHSVGARGITIVNSKQELIDKLPQIQSQYGSCALQEFIENDDYYYNVFFPLRFVQKQLDKSDYSIAYFHIGDLLPESSEVMTKVEYEKYFKEPGTLINRYKRHIKGNLGKKNAFKKLSKLIENNDFLNIEEADKAIEWRRSINL